MNRHVFEKVEERSEGICENPKCKRWYGKGLQKHHIFFGTGKRRKMEMVETVVDLCYECHEGYNGVHRNRKLDLYFKRLAQKRLVRLGWSKDKIIKECGRWYLDEKINEKTDNME